jgi:LmbE family N-acetylglucosaminyl deacetylase
MAEGERPALYHIAVDSQTAEFYRQAQGLTGSAPGFHVEVEDRVDVVIELDADEVMMKLRAIDCHRSQLEDWRIALRDHPHLMQRGYGHEPYVAVSSRATGLTENGLLGDFA